ncbi:MAG: urease accessory protein UreF [Paracoccaceae bacterium]|nr:MAG: urease accessory protein UreF [Paracoccaceae bacterium]
MTAPLRDAPAAAWACDPAALMTLVQWLSPAFPTGAFGYSHGMETAIQRGEVPDSSSVRAWIGDVLAHGAPRGDAILLAHALRPNADHAALADLARALSATAERLRETEEQGAALSRATNALRATDHPPLPWPVALGRAAGPLGLPVPVVLGLALQSFAANLVTVAVRFVPLGQTEGQAVLASLQAPILRLAEEAATAPLSAIASAAIRADIASALHETLNVRMFRT